jgi:hypothetical protein
MFCDVSWRVRGNIIYPLPPISHSCSNGKRVHGNFPFPSRPPGAIESSLTQRGSPLQMHIQTDFSHGTESTPCAARTACAAIIQSVQGLPTILRKLRHLIPKKYKVSDESFPYCRSYIITISTPFFPHVCEGDVTLRDCACGKLSPGTL